MDEPVRWRVDASTSRAVRVLWAAGVGTLLAAVVLVAVSRLFALTVAAGWTVAGIALLAALVGIAATILALAVAGDPGARLAALRRSLGPVARPIGSLGRRLPDLPSADPAGDDPEPESGPDPRRALDAGVAAVVAAAYLVGMVFGVGGPAGDGLAAVALPLALVAIVLATVMRSTGAIDPEGPTLYLAEPAEEVDLETIEGVSLRRIGDGALVTLEYAQPDGEYVPGPRRLFVPAEVGRRLERLVEAGTTRPRQRGDD